MGVSRAKTRQSEPNLGLFSLMFSTPGYLASPRRDKWGKTSYTPSNNPYHLMSSHKIHNPDPHEARPSP